MGNDILVAEGPKDDVRVLSSAPTFRVGLGFQLGAIFADHLPDWSRGTLDNGMAAGASSRWS